MERARTLLLIILITALATVPIFVALFSPQSFPGQTGLVMIAFINFSGWVLALAFFLLRGDIKKRLAKIASDLGIDTRALELEPLVRRVVFEIQRKNSASSMNIVEKRLATKDDFGQTLEKIVALSYRLLDAESAELALFDKESGLYHSSFVLGKPFRKSAQAMLSGAFEAHETETSPGVIVQPISFSGTTLGTLRVGLKKSRLPSQPDKEIMKILALQGGLAIINSQYTKELMRMKHTSEESVRAKTGFLANLSHEIRGPLGIMLNAVELVLDGLCGPINEDQLDTLKMVHSNGEHLLDLINDVLDYAKVESGKITVTKTTLSINELCKDITGVVRAQADAKGHKLTATPCDDTLAISVDKRHIRQMMINLLTNAIKYTPDKGSIDVWAEPTAGGRVKICVRDSGVGIEESQRHKVFAAFERVENSYSLQQMGTGLGMPLTKRLCEVNGGLIDFTSTPGKGSTFWVSFPLTEATQVSQASVEVTPEAQGNGDTVLLIEKGDGERDMIARYLSHIGFKVLPVATSAEAQQSFRVEKISIAIIDNNIIDRPDDDLVVSLRDAAKAQSLPVILVTSRAFVFDIEKYLKSGVDRCLVKPIELKELGRICRSLIDGTYSGAVVDDEVLALAPRESDTQKQPKKFDPTETRVETSDDILH